MNVRIITSIPYYIVSTPSNTKWKSVEWTMLLIMTFFSFLSILLVILFDYIEIEGWKGWMMVYCFILYAIVRWKMDKGRRLLRRFIEKHEAIKMEFWDEIKYKKKEEISLKESQLEDTFWIKMLCCKNDPNFLEIIST